MSRVEQYFLVNSDGEVIKSVESPNVVSLNEGDRILRYSSKKLLRDTTKIQFKFIKTNDRYLGEINRIAPLVCDLLRYIHYSSNLLIYENYVYVSPRNFAMSMGISESTVRRQFQKLEKLEVIKKVPINGCKYAYYFNPYVACRSSRIEVDTLNLFCKSKYVRSDK